MNQGLLFLHLITFLTQLFYITKIHTADTFNTSKNITLLMQSTVYYSFTRHVL